MKKNLKHIISALAIGLVLTACGGGGTEDTSTPADDNNEPADTEETVSYNIGATQIVEHPSLDAAFEGFQKALEDAGLDVTYNFQSAQGDQNNTSAIANNFVADQVDLIFANSTPSALGALQATNDIPILFTSVTDAVGAGLVTAMDEPGENITGVLDLHPESIEMTVDFIDNYLPDSSIGLIYNSGEPNSVVQIRSEEHTSELQSR